MPELCRVQHLRHTLKHTLRHTLKHTLKHTLLGPVDSWISFDTQLVELGPSDFEVLANVTTRLDRFWTQAGTETKQAAIGNSKLGYKR